MLAEAGCDAALFVDIAEGPNAVDDVVVGDEVVVCIGACFEEKNLCSSSSIRRGLISDE